MATTNGLSTPLSLVRFLHVLKIIPNKDSPTKEEVGTGDGATTVFWLDNLGVIEDTYTIYKGATEAAATALTETTHYTIDLDTSKITLTSAGVTLVATNKIYAAYKYSFQDLSFLNSDLLNALNAAEDKLLNATECVFTNTTLLGYKAVSDEPIKAHCNPYDKVFDLYRAPIVKIATTVNGAYTTGGVSITLTDASYLPSSGTIYIGGNKVAYTAKASHTLTIPATTPSIADGATVRGEVVELNVQPEGTEPSYTVLTPDTEYEIDYFQGRLKVLTNAYFGEVYASDRLYPTNNLIKVTYLHAWHDKDQDPTIPDEIEWCVNAIASRKLMGSVVSKAHTAGLNDFNPKLIEVDKESIQEVIDNYRFLNVGTSPYNRQSLS